MRSHQALARGNPQVYECDVEAKKRDLIHFEPIYIRQKQQVLHHWSCTCSPLKELACSRAHQRFYIDPQFLQNVPVRVELTPEIGNSNPEAPQEIAHQDTNPRPGWDPDPLLRKCWVLTGFDSQHLNRQIASAGKLCNSTLCTYFS